MTDLTKKNKGIGKWDNKCDNAFQKLKNAVTQGPILVSPNWKKTFRGHVDASQTAAGGSCHQLKLTTLQMTVSFWG